MTQALSTVVNTPFGRQCTVTERYAIAEAQSLADDNGAPVGVWARDGWYTVCEVAPDLIEPDPTLTGWVLWAIVDPLTAIHRDGGAQFEWMANQDLDY